MGWRIPCALLLLSLGATPLLGQPSIVSYSVNPDYYAYGPDTPITIRMELSGGESQGYKLVLQTQLLQRQWDVAAGVRRSSGTHGTPESPLEVQVDAFASPVNFTLTATTPNLIQTEPRTFVKVEKIDSGGNKTLLKQDLRFAGRETVAATPAPSPTPTPAPTSTPSPSPVPRGTLKIVLEPPGLQAPIYLDGRWVGNGSYLNETIPLGQYLVSFGPAEGHEAPESKVVSLSAATPSVLLTGSYRVLAIPAPSPSPPAPSPPPASSSAFPSPAPAPSAAVPIAAAVGIAAAVAAAVLALQKRKGAPPPAEPPAPEAPPPETPPPEPPAEPKAPEEPVPSEVPLGVLQEKRQKLERRMARLEEQKSAGEVSAEEYEERRKKYEREREELDQKIQKRSG